MVNTHFTRNNISVANSRVKVYFAVCLKSMSRLIDKPK